MEGQDQRDDNDQIDDDQIVTSGHPEKLIIQLKHYKQRFNWDCGIACILMILGRKERHNFLTNFSHICKTEGFRKSTWTIDLCYLLSRFKIKHIFYTITIGVNKNHQGNKYYSHAVLKDETRVVTKFQNAQSNGITVLQSSLSSKYILDHLIDGPVIVLTNANLLHCDICKINKISKELRKCIPLPVPYSGHYIVLCGYNIHTKNIYYRNPTYNDRVCVMSLDSFDAARKSNGTDEDLIFIYK